MHSSSAFKDAVTQYFEKETEKTASEVVLLTNFIKQLVALQPGGFNLSVFIACYV